MQNKNLNQIEIRENTGQFSNWTELLDLVQTAFKSMEGRINPPSSMHKLTSQNLAQKATEETLIYANCEDKLVGCAFAYDREDALYIGKVSIAPDFQGHGLGKSIVEACKKLAKRKGCNELELETRIELTENHEFFSKLGFVKISEKSHEGFDRPTSITMRCKV